MPDAIDLEQKNREEARWRMLRVVDAGRPIAVSEQIIWRVLADIKLSLSLNTVRRELSYRRRVQLPGPRRRSPPAQVLVRIEPRDA
jgi:hypothetical protein